MTQQLRELIVNADDFGMSVGINDGIIGAHRSGILTSASLMVLRPAAKHAVTAARLHTDLSIGLHLDLCEWVYANDEWQLSYEIIRLSDMRAVKNELHRQLNLFKSLTGNAPSHIDSHQHVHRSEPIRSIVLDVARQLDIPVREETPGIAYTGRFYGQTNKGESYPDGISRSSLIHLLQILPNGTTELACHPAKRVDFQSVYNKERVMEHEVLCDAGIARTVSNAGIQLTSFQGRTLSGTLPDNGTQS